MTDTLSINPNNALDSLISTLLFAMSTIRYMMAQCTWLALTPLRISWNITTWIISHTINIAITVTTYPPVTTLLMVIGCGLLIGACAGFGVELITSMLLSATWGKEKKASDNPITDMEDDKVQDDEHQLLEQDDMDDVVEMRLATTKSRYDIFQDDDDDDNDAHKDPQENDGQDNHEANDAMYELLQHHLASVASNTNSDDNTQLRRRTPH